MGHRAARSAGSRPRVRILELEHQLDELRAELKALKTPRQQQPKVKSALERYRAVSRFPGPAPDCHF